MANKVQPQYLTGAPQSAPGGMPPSSSQGPGGPQPAGSYQHNLHPDQIPLMSLGHIKNLGDSRFEYLEWTFRKQLRDLSTVYWPMMQGGDDEEALSLWKDLWVLLELDADSWLELMLLVSQGPPGRSEANQILFELMTRWASMGEYKNLSRKVSTMIKAARRAIDRPPDDHSDLRFWTVQRAMVARYPEFLPEKVPTNGLIQTAESGAPLRPPQCWVPPPPPEDLQAPPAQQPYGGPQSSSWTSNPSSSEAQPGRRGAIKWR